jgi:hypothetical protein
MQQLPTMSQLQMMSDEEVAIMNQKLARRALRNVVIFAGIKIAIAYGLHRWAKSMADAS